MIEKSEAALKRLTEAELNAYCLAMIQEMQNKPSPELMDRGLRLLFYLREPIDDEGRRIENELWQVVMENPVFSEPSSISQPDRSAVN